ncbi:dihydroorotase [Propionigenium maris DSM 9537]|uniref:Dihydroorotase n=1 Tax=Propionigenium maris DSM 9537 TaxID=1123000 RepID=A0A9W6LM25_9FUSO|nr:dihydroorotase family protein [Propionigenium maris]GLI54993.1 dihydroorotase [Propionigenium maris DSM 9537]
MLIKNCKLIDREGLVDILIQEGKIAKIEAGMEYSGEILDAQGKDVLPGMIDVHTHMREPGMTHKETIETGSMACAKGGVTTYIDMPNTNPATITVEALEEKRRLSEEKSIVNFGFNFGGSLDNNSDEIRRAQNIVATKVFLNISTGKMLIENDEVLGEIFEASEKVMVHAEGEMVQKAIDFARKYNKKLYLCHISQESELELVREARKDYKEIYVEVTPHHLFLNLEEQTQRLRMKPELKPQTDVDAMWRAIEEGMIDTLGTDHAPHTLEEKDAKVTFGIPGIETAMPLMLDAVNEGRLTLAKLVEMYSTKPAEIFNLKGKGRLEAGYDADIIIVDMERRYTLKNEEIVSRCGWTPFDGREVKGRVETTVVNGNVIYSADNEDKFNKINGREVKING